MSNATATVGYRNRYGAVETNGLVDGAAYHDQVDYSQRLTLKQLAEEGGKITRVRLIGERRIVDVSYIHAELPDGTLVTVNNGLDNLLPLRSIKGKMIEWAKREGVFAKNVGLLDEGNWSISMA